MRARCSCSSLRCEPRCAGHGAATRCNRARVRALAISPLPTAQTLRLCHAHIANQAHLSLALTGAALAESDPNSAAGSGPSDLAGMSFSLAAKAPKAAADGMQRLLLSKAVGEAMSAEAWARAFREVRARCSYPREHERMRVTRFVRPRAVCAHAAGRALVCA